MLTAIFYSTGISLSLLIASLPNGCSWVEVPELDLDMLSLTSLTS
jgi:hypothetical protein